MDIKDFIEESLLQIVDGIANANRSLTSRGSYIPNKDIKGEGGYYDTSVLAHVNGVEHYQETD